VALIPVFLALGLTYSEDFGSADISQLSFVVISVIFLAVEQGVEEDVIIVLRALSAPVYF